MKMFFKKVFAQIMINVLFYMKNIARFRGPRNQAVTRPYVAQYAPISNPTLLWIRRGKMEQVRKINK